MGVQDRLRNGLRPHPLPHGSGAAHDLASQAKGRLVRDLRQRATGAELRQDRRVGPVGLDARLGDQPHLARVGDHPRPMCGRITSATALAVPVAATTTWPARVRFCANATP